MSIGHVPDPRADEPLDAGESATESHNWASSARHYFAYGTGIWGLPKPFITVIWISKP